MNEIAGTEDLKLIPLSGRTGAGLFATVNAEDYFALSQFIWHCSSTGYAARKGYIEGKRTVLFMHRLILSASHGVHVDHINGNPLDNRRANLRLVSHSENMRNRKSVQNATSVYKGVWWDKSQNRWRAEIRFEGRKINLGGFDSEEEAARAYDSASRQYHGVHGRQNFN